jgi:hypothetical protein
MGPDSHAIDIGLEQAVGKTQSLVHLAQPWAFGRKADGTPNYQPFALAMLQGPTARGSLVLLDWASWDLQNQLDPAFSLDVVIAGQHDAYLHTWARSAAASGLSFMLRFDAEMNGGWPPYGAQPAKCVAAWRHVHDIFVAEGATRVAWCWCPNMCAPKGSGATQTTAEELLSAYYPGDDLVDWTGFDGYNWSVGDGGPWRSFASLMSGYPGWEGDSYGAILRIAPHKPMGLFEFGCWDDPRKATWLFDALARLPIDFPQLRAISYFNWPSNGALWPLAGDALEAFRLGIASPVYLPAGVWTDPKVAPVFEVSVAPVGQVLQLQAALAAAQATLQTTRAALASDDAASVVLTSAVATRDATIASLQSKSASDAQAATQALATANATVAARQAELDSVRANLAALSAFASKPNYGGTK